MDAPRSTPGSDDPVRPSRRPDRCQRVALVLQGGGALGAYQGGVYEALHEAGIEPDWLAGVSIGAINAALIAGNAPEHRLDRLRKFWDRITERPVWLFAPDVDLFRQWHNQTSSWLTVSLGQPGFFEPRRVAPWFSLPGADGATSYYDTSPLRDTLRELVDFDYLKSRATTLAVGAVDVATGNSLYFDNREIVLGPEHIMASGALPPGFPAIRIGNSHYWDGGLISNTPLQYLLEQKQDLDTLAFQVDLFSARGPLPRSIQDVASRQKDIQFSSRTRLVTDAFREILGWQKRAHQLLSRLPEAELSDDDRNERERLAQLPEFMVLQLIYQQKAYEGEARDYEFSRESMLDHWRSGYEDTRRTLEHQQWLQIPPEGTGVVTHDIHRRE